MDERVEWERVFGVPFPEPEPRPVPLYVVPQDVQPGMRIHNGFDSYMVVVEAPVTVLVSGEGDGARSLTTIAYTVGGGTRVYRARWADYARMPVVTPSIYVREAY